MKKIIYCIGRQYGSAGKDIGKQLSQKLNIPFYDKELLVLAAKESGIDTDLFEKCDEKVDFSYYYLNAIGYTIGSNMAGLADVSLNDRLFVIQSKIIEDIADKGSCVIVGRCADYILRDNPNAVSVFIHADIDDRINRVKDVYKEESRDFENLIAKTDKRRTNYYNYYTDRKWARADSYDLTISSSKFGIDGAVELLMDLAK
ncbi:MAG: cytidylate kinase-like family protein [Erysipelotrichaceae bacterium]